MSHGYIDKGYKTIESIEDSATQQSYRLLLTEIKYLQATIYEHEEEISNIKRSIRERRRGWRPNKVAKKLILFLKNIFGTNIRF